jgi:diguanylate cyclase (GGDEF)-like protein
LKTIGLLSTNLFGDYFLQLLPGVIKGARERGANLLIYPGRTDNWADGYIHQQSVIYSKVNPSTVDAIIVIAGTYANLYDADQYTAFFEQFRDLPGVSLGLRAPYKSAILVDNKTGLEELVRHVMAEHGCIRPAMVTGPLANEEARTRLETFRSTCRSLGFAIGDNQVFEGDFLRSGGRDAVRTLFSASRKGNHPDALFCANDNMAFGALRELQALGLRVPADVVVTGFDDAQEAQFSFPALSTINQPLEEQGYQGVLMAMDLCEGKPVPGEIYLPTRMVLRSSCGCYSATEQSYATAIKRIGDKPPVHKKNSALEESFWTDVGLALPLEEQTPRSRSVLSHLLKAACCGKGEEKALTGLGEHLQNLIDKGQTVRPWVSMMSLIRIFLEKNNGILDDSYDSALFLGSCLQIVVSMIRVEQGRTQFHLMDQITDMRTYLGSMGSALTLEDIGVITKTQLTGLGVKSFYIALYDKPVTRKRGEPWIGPEYSRVVIGYRKGQEITGKMKNKKIRRELLLPPEASGSREPSAMIICGIHFRNEIMGYMMIDMTDITLEIYDILTGHISSSLKTASLFEEREASEQKLREVLHDLEKSNSQLQRISEIDELTGLYNRRGFLNLARRSMELARQMGRGGLVFFADLDGLKQINDIYGHKDGDLAIKTAAEILRKTFRNMDILSRLGGDEFTVLALDTDAGFLPVLRKRMDDLLTEANEKLGKPWKVSISIGCAPFHADDNTPLEKLMTQADDKLYREKRSKKKR